MERGAALGQRQRLAMGRIIPLQNEAGDRRRRQIREHPIVSAADRPWSVPGRPREGRPAASGHIRDGRRVREGKVEGEFDIVWTDWSEFDHLRIDVKNNTLLVADVDQTEAWNDSYSFRLGYAYHINDRHQV